MNISSIDNYSNKNIAATLEHALQSAGASANTSGTSTNSTSSVNGQSSDSSQLSPFAQLLSVLQQLQQSNPTQYQQVTQQIAANLQTAAQTAAANGNTAQANQLTQLSKDFTTASTSGQLPNIQDLAHAMSGGHHHHGGGFSSNASDSDGDSSSSSAANTSSSNQALEQILSAFQSLSNQINASQNTSTDPISVIAKTLSDAGIKLS